MDQHVAADAEALLFPNRTGGHLQPSTFYQPFYDARTAVGLSSLRLHDLRHVALTMAAQAGATTKELMQRAGHSTATMALHYQGVAAGRDAQLAAALSALVGKPEEKVQGTST